MPPRECTALLQWALPRMGFRWEGFRKVRRQVCRRLDARRQLLGLPDVGAYRPYLEAHPDEWDELAILCRITISRFYRDLMVFDRLRELLRERSTGTGTLRAWSAGCASGEEPWTLRLLCRLEEGVDDIRVTATDIDPHMIARATAGRYPATSLRELPTAWRGAGFHRSKDAMRLRDELREGVTFAVQDLRTQQPDGPFDLILCRNLAFMYFDEDGQRRTLSELVRRLAPEGLLVIGRNETLPAGHGLLVVDGGPGLFRLP